MIVFSRPSYFCLCACLILALHYASQTWSETVFSLYGAPFTVHGSLIFARNFVIGENCVSMLFVCVIFYEICALFATGEENINIIMMMMVTAIMTSVLGCVTQCLQSAAHSYEQFLQIQQIGFVTLGPLCHA